MALIGPPVILSTDAGTEWLDHVLCQAYHHLVLTSPNQDINVRVELPGGTKKEGTVGWGRVMFVTPTVDGVVKVYRRKFEGDDNMGAGTGIAYYAA